ncbi:hypothetical protein CJ739_1356 [Mariniflexile rhizosphaerae]|uniref:hypothetical protein n=1 Tax=unclassified Mariniflexile TaxID=2643887 RepID=UPI000CC0EE77|nr:hypothetical protein [Mariniflexile sp. TRM1-10]AXP80445.1 hypothetical protein CJ739_1356 [Mariniflexile sp. TRM1-10]PLB20532.1 MAG: hypothetical protein TRG1_514 [Flavobacteriaceae bacterium FS1-H7996/R]
MNVCPVTLLLLLFNISPGQEFKTTSKDDTSFVINLNLKRTLNGSVSNKYPIIGLGNNPKFLVYNSSNEFVNVAYFNQLMSQVFLI